MARSGMGHMDAGRLCEGAVVFGVVALWVFFCFLCLLLLLIPVNHAALYVLYTHMIKQRRKVLGGGRTLGSRKTQ